MHAVIVHKNIQHKFDITSKVFFPFVNKYFVLRVVEKC